MSDRSTDTDESAAAPAPDDTESADRGSPEGDPPWREAGTSHEDDDGGYSGLAVLGSAIVGLVVTALSWWAANAFDVFHEPLFRVRPTVAGRGVGASWVAGNTNTALDFLIALIHAADVLMGVLILVMVFVHWAAFRRLAGQMRQPGEAGRGDVAADGGTPTDGDDGPRAYSAGPNGGDPE